MAGGGQDDHSESGYSEGELGVGVGSWEETLIEHAYQTVVHKGAMCPLWLPPLLAVVFICLILISCVWLEKKAT